LTTKYLHDVRLDPDRSAIAVIPWPLRPQLETAHVTKSAAMHATHVGIERPRKAIAHPFDADQRRFARLLAIFGAHTHSLTADDAISKHACHSAAHILTVVIVRRYCAETTTETGASNGEQRVP